MALDVVLTCLPVIPAGAGPLAKGVTKGAQLIGKGEQVVKGVDKLAEGAKDAEKVTQGLKQSTHHILTNKNDKWTYGFNKIVEKYNLDLEGDWNKIEIPQNGRHPDAYHEAINNELVIIDREAGGDTSKFMDLFNQRIKTPLQENPEMIFKEYYYP